MNSIETNPEIIEARKKLAEKFGNMKLGGKGNVSSTNLSYQDLREERKSLSTSLPPFKTRRFSPLPRRPVRKIFNIYSLIEARKLNDIQEVNIFRDDNSILHFKKPSYEYSPKEKCSFLTGPHEIKHIKDLLPNILKQLGPKQYSFMKDYVDQLKAKDQKGDKIEEAPELVEDFEEVSNKKN